MKIVYTTGVFDMLHPGHINILKNAKSFGEKLIVGIQSDNSAYKQKGRLPILNQEQRKIMLENLILVDEVLIYDNIDQTEILKKIRADILVQGSDWEENTDRTKIKNYLKKNNITLKKIQYTKGISTSEIRNKVINSFYLNEDKNKIFNNIKILSINDICLYEKSSKIRTKGIINSIKKSNILKNPVVTININGKYILIDGNNRLQSLKKIGIKNILVHNIDYLDEKKLNLLNNIHYLNIDEKVLLKKIKNKKINIKKIENLEEYNNLIINNKIDFSIKTLENIYISEKEPTLEKTIKKLNSLVNLYINDYEINRVSEIKEDSDTYNTNIIFRKFTKNDIINLVEKGLTLESGITWHKLNINILNINLNIDLLKNEKIYINKEINKLPIRHFFGNTFIFNN